MGKRIIRLSPEIFSLLFSPGDHPRYRISGDPIPKDARAVNACFRFDFGTPQVLVLLESSEWEDFIDGSPYPEVVPVVTVIPDPVSP